MYNIICFCKKNNWKIVFKKDEMIATCRFCSSVRHFSVTKQISIDKDFYKIEKVDGKKSYLKINKKKIELKKRKIK